MKLDTSPEAIVAAWNRARADAWTAYVTSLPHDFPTHEQMDAAHAAFLAGWNAANATKCCPACGYPDPLEEGYCSKCFAEVAEYGGH